MFTVQTMFNSMKTQIEDSDQLALFYGKCVLAVHYILYKHKREYL